MSLKVNLKKLLFFVTILLISNLGQARLFVGSETETDILSIHDYETAYLLDENKSVICKVSVNNIETESIRNCFEDEAFLVQDLKETITLDTRRAEATSLTLLIVGGGCLAGGLAVGAKNYFFPSEEREIVENGLVGGAAASATGTVALPLASTGFGAGGGVSALGAVTGAAAFSIPGIICGAATEWGYSVFLSEE